MGTTFAMIIAFNLLWEVPAALPGGVRSYWGITGGM
jgi:hypothetical protein